jgi:hypothetical protein
VQKTKVPETHWCRKGRSQKHTGAEKEGPRNTLVQKRKVQETHWCRKGRAKKHTGAGKEGLSKAGVTETEWEMSDFGLLLVLQI